MNLNDIKGVIEINGESYDPKMVLKALIDQGLKIHPLNGTLLVGRTFIDATPNLQQGSIACPFIEQCKIFDRLLPQNSSANTSSEYNSVENYSPSNYSSDSPDSSIDRFYTDPIQIDIDDIDITSLFSDTPNEPSKHEDYNNLDTDPTEMVGLSPVTRYGKVSKIQESSIPEEYRGRCPNCKSVVNIMWMFCGNCGASIV